MIKLHDLHGILIVTFILGVTAKGPVTFLGSDYSLPCQDECLQRGSDYTWCETARGWDYCSLSPEIDTKGSVCSTACTHAQINLQNNVYEEEDYTWCNVVGGSWGYCGIVTGWSVDTEKSYQRMANIKRFWGGDIFQNGIYASTLGVCEKICGYMENCVAYEYIHPTQRCLVKDVSYETELYTLRFKNTTSGYMLFPPNTTEEHKPCLMKGIVFYGSLSGKQIEYTPGTDLPYWPYEYLRQWEDDMIAINECHM